MSGPVEIKVTVGGRDGVGTIDTSLRRLHLDLPETTRQIWFLEEPLGSDTEPRLLSAGIILRLRTDSTRRDDSTVKLRPCQGSQLKPPWTAGYDPEDGEFRVEQDWAGQRHVLAASCVSKFPRGEMGRLLADGNMSKAFKEQQLAFLTECTGRPVLMDGLTPLGPITVARWESTDLDGAVVERWTVDDLDFLELSVRVDEPSGAVQRQSTFEKAITDSGVPIAGDQETKTKQVLRHLLARREEAAPSEPGLRA